MVCVVKLYIDCVPRSLVIFATIPDYPCVPGDVEDAGNSWAQPIHLPGSGPRGCTEVTEYRGYSTTS